MKKLLSLILCLSLIFTAIPSFAEKVIKPQAEPDGYITVLSESRTKVVTEQEAYLSSISNFAVLTTFSYGLGAIASVGFGILTTMGVDSLHAGETVTTFTTITYDKKGKEFDYVQRTIIKRGNYLASDHTFIESFPEGSRVYAGWWNDFKYIISQGGL